MIRWLEDVWEGFWTMLVGMKITWRHMFTQPATLQADYARSPAWLQQLMNAFADGLNFYLYKHPDVHPRVITRFEPWMALSFTEGSIGGDIERVNLRRLEARVDAVGNIFGRLTSDETNAKVLLVGVSDPTSRYHGPNESVDLTDLESAIVAQAIALRE